MTLQQKIQNLMWITGDGQSLYTSKEYELASDLILLINAVQNELTKNDCNCGHEDGNGLCFLHEALQKILEK